MTADRDELLEYYQRELSYLRAAGADFARSYPKIASRLQLGPEGTPDPHVERLIKSFAYLTARVQRSTDGDFPRLTDALLGLLHPQLASSVPAMAIARFCAEAPPPTGAVLPRGLAVAALTSDDLRCRFRTCYETTLWPIRLDPPGHLATGHWDFLDRETAVSAIQLTFRGPPASFAALASGKLRLFLGSTTGTVHRLCDTLLGACDRVVFIAANGQRVIVPAADALCQVGFESDEAVVPDTAQGHPAYRLLREYFTFPEKFRFLDLAIPPEGRLPGLSESDQLQVLFLLPETPRGGFALSDDSFQLGCTPVVNLFPQVADPIRLDYRHGEDPGDSRRAVGARDGGSFNSRCSRQCRARRTKDGIRTIFFSQPRHRGTPAAKFLDGAPVAHRPRRHSRYGHLALVRRSLAKTVQS